MRLNTKCNKQRYPFNHLKNYIVDLSIERYLPTQFNGESTMSTKHTLLPATQHPDHLIDMKYITALTGMTDKWFYALIKAERFPEPIKLGRSSRWRLREIEAWIREQANR